MPIENLEPRHPRLDPEKVMKDEFYKKFCALKDGDSIKYKDKIYVKGGPGGDQEEELLIRAIGAGCKKPFTAEEKLAIHSEIEAAGAGKKAEVMRKHGVAPSSYHRWKQPEELEKIEEEANNGKLSTLGDRPLGMNEEGVMTVIKSMPKYKEWNKLKPGEAVTFGTRYTYTRGQARGDNSDKYNEETLLRRLYYGMKSNETSKAEAKKAGVSVHQYKEERASENKAKKSGVKPKKNGKKKWVVEGIDGFEPQGQVKKASNETSSKLISLVHDAPVNEGVGGNEAVNDAMGGHTGGERVVRLKRGETPNTQPKKKARGSYKSFDERLETLKAYKEKHGHVDVEYTDDDDADRSLYSFCSSMRYSHKKGKLTKPREEALNALGFVWASHTERKNAPSSPPSEITGSAAAKEGVVLAPSALTNSEVAAKGGVVDEDLSTPTDKPWPCTNIISNTFLPPSSDVQSMAVVTPDGPHSSAPKPIEGVNAAWEWSNKYWTLEGTNLICWPEGTMFPEGLSNCLVYQIDTNRSTTPPTASEIDRESDKKSCIIS